MEIHCEVSETSESCTVEVDVSDTVATLCDKASQRIHSARTEAKCVVNYSLLFGGEALDGDTAISATCLESGCKVSLVVAAHTLQCREYQMDVVCKLALSPCGRYCATGMHNETHIYDLVTGVRVHTYTTSGFFLALTDEYIALATNMQTTEVLIRNYKESDRGAVKVNHSGFVNALCATHCGEWLVGAWRTQECTLRVIDIRTGHTARETLGDFNFVSEVAVSRCAKWVACAENECVSLHLFDTLVRVSSFPMTRRVLSVSFSHCSSFVAVSSSSGEVCLIDVEHGRAATHYPVHTDWARGVVISPCGAYVVSFGDDARVMQSHLSTGVLAHEYTFNRSIYSGAISPCSRYLITGGANGTLTVSPWKSTHSDA